MVKNKLKLNGYSKWILVALAFCGIMWNAATLHFSVRQNTAILQNDVYHLSAEFGDMKIDIKKIYDYLLKERNKE